LIEAEDEQMFLEKQSEVLEQSGQQEDSADIDAKLQRLAKGRVRRARWSSQAGTIIQSIFFLSLGCRDDVPCLHWKGSAQQAARV
jgi:hypothetical protein